MGVPGDCSCFPEFCLLFPEMSREQETVIMPVRHLLRWAVAMAEARCGVGHRRHNQRKGLVKSDLFIKKVFVMLPTAGEAVVRSLKLRDAFVT